MRSGIIITLLATLGWFWFCHYWYTCWIQQACYACGTQKTELPVISMRSPLDFQWNQDQPFTNEGWASAKSTILQSKSDHNVLEITGNYYAEEAKPVGFANMGEARAAKMIALFTTDLPVDRIRLKGALRDRPLADTSLYFEAAEFKWLDVDQTPAQSVEQLDNKVLIRFPFDSIKREKDKEIEAYLDTLADLLKKQQKKVKLTGHTDSIGTASNNVVLGLARAKTIRDALRSRGVSRDQIIVESQGHTAPIATNDTDAGRHNNRRVEIVLLP